MVGVGNAIGQAIEIVLNLSFFATIVTPIISLLGFIKKNIFRNLNGRKK
jgi:hypothetical protein